MEEAWVFLGEHVCCILITFTCATDFVSVAGVVLTSTVEENGRQFACEGEMVTFTCQVIRSITIQWDSPLIRQIVLSAGSTVSTSRPPFIASLTSIVGSGLNANITSTLQVNASRTFRRNETTVQCSNQQSVTEKSRFTVAGNKNTVTHLIISPEPVLPVNVTA